MKIANLEEIGSRLGLSGSDIDEIRSSDRKWKIVSSLIGILLVIIALIIGLIFGWFAGNEGSSNDGYPFALPIFATIGSMKRRRNGIKLFVPIALIAFLAGISTPVFGNGIRYGVFNRRSV